MEENKQNVTDVKPETEENKPQSDLEAKAAELKEDAIRDFDAASEKAREQGEKFKAEASEIKEQAKETAATLQADWKHAAKEADANFREKSAQAGTFLKEQATKLDDLDTKGFDQAGSQFEEFASQAGDKVNDLKQKAAEKIDDFADQLQKDPKEAMIEAAKAGLMFIGAIALLKGIFKH